MRTCVIADSVLFKPEADIEFSRRELDHYLSAGHSYRTSPNDLFPAFFALDRYLKQRPDDASALHMFGLVCERIGHIELAIDRTDHAITLLEVAYEETEDPIIERQYIIANTTVARLRLAVRDYENALSSFQIALGLLPEEGEEKVLRSQCLFGSGLASFKLGALDEALESFEAALVTAADDLHMRGHVTVLLAQTLWAIGTEEGREAAKTQLLDWYARLRKGPFRGHLLIAAAPGAGIKHHTGPGELDRDQRARRHGHSDRRRWPNRRRPVRTQISSPRPPPQTGSATRLFVHPETELSGPGKQTIAIPCRRTLPSLHPASL
jgi:Tetratricopeptide repeat